MSTEIAKNAELETGIVEALSTEEVNDFCRLEGVVRRGMAKFREVGEALAEIKAKALYRADYGSWASYLEERWHLGPQWAHRLIQTSQAAAEIEAAGLPAPASAGQVEPLVNLDPETRAEVWVEAHATAGDRGPTRADVEDAVEKVAPEKARARKTARKPRGETPIEEGVRTGAIPEGATVEERDLTGPAEGQVSGETSPRGDGDAGSVRAEETDEEYLARCPAREKLSEACRKRFDVEALAFRALAPIRREFATAAKKITNAAKRRGKGHIGPWMARHFRYLQISAPSAWVACKDCDGSGQVELIGACASCKGEGYHV